MWNKEGEGHSRGGAEWGSSHKENNSLPSAVNWPCLVIPTNIIFLLLQIHWITQGQAGNPKALVLNREWLWNHRGIVVGAMPKRGNRWTERGEPTKEKTVNIIMIQRMEEIQMFWDRGKFIFPTAGELHYTILLVLLAWLVLGSCPSPAPCHPSIKKPINSRSSSGSHGPHQLCWADTEYYSPFVGNSWHQHEGSFTSGFCLIRFSRAFS